MTEPLLFLAACATLLFVPGPTNALLLAAGAARGWRGSLELGLVVLAAYAVSITVSRLMLEPLLTAYPLLARAARGLLGVYVLWLAGKMWSAALRNPHGVEVPAWQVFVATLLNPKGFVLAFVILPAGEAARGSHYAAVAAVVLAASLCWGLSGALLARATRAHGTRLVPRLSALALGLFGGLTLSSALG